MIIPIENPTFKNGFCLNISQKWGENKEYYLKNFGINGHNGIDFAYLNPLGLFEGQSSYGRPILAAHKGTVSRIVWEGEHSTQGNGVYLISDEYEIVYWHLSKITCVLGASVAEGDVLGEMGNSGFVRPVPNFTNNTTLDDYNGTHLHFGVRPLINGQLKYPSNGFGGYVDPWPYLTMLKIVGDKTSGRQYVLGNDQRLRWIFNETILSDLHEAGVVSKFEVEWKDSLAGYEISNPWACIK